eukprot:166206_1
MASLLRSVFDGNSETPEEEKNNSNNSNNNTYNHSEDSDSGSDSDSDSEEHKHPEYAQRWEYLDVEQIVSIHFGSLFFWSSFLSSWLSITSKASSGLLGYT